MSEPWGPLKLRQRVADCYTGDYGTVVLQRWDGKKVGVKMDNVEHYGEKVLWLDVEEAWPITEETDGQG